MDEYTTSSKTPAPVISLESLITTVYEVRARFNDVPQAMACRADVLHRLIANYSGPWVPTEQPVLQARIMGIPVYTHSALPPGEIRIGTRDQIIRLVQLLGPEE